MQRKTSFESTTILANGDLIVHFPTRDVVLSKHFQDVMEAKALFFKVDSPTQLNRARRTITAKWTVNPISGDWEDVTISAPHYVIAEGPTSYIILSKDGIDFENSKYI